MSYRSKKGAIRRSSYPRSLQISISDPPLLSPVDDCVRLASPTLGMGAMSGPHLSFSGNRVTFAWPVNLGKPSHQAIGTDTRLSSKHRKWNVSLTNEQPPRENDLSSSTPNN